MTFSPFKKIHKKIQKFTEWYNMDKRNENELYASFSLLFQLFTMNLSENLFVGWELKNEREMRETNFTEIWDNDEKEKNLKPPRSQTFPWNNMETMGCNSEIKIHFVLLQLSSICSWIKYYVYFIMECLFVVVTVLWKSIVLSWHAWWGSI